MTESLSIVEQERAQASEQATARAIANLQRAGYEHATPEIIEFLSKNFAPLSKMRGLLKQYGDSINGITDNVDADEEQRIEAYAELRNHIVPQYEEAAKELEHELSVRREELQQDVFGIPATPAASPADRHAAAQDYRDALYRLADATPEQLDKAARLAEASGDTMLLRAVGLIADQRGDRATVERYLERAGEKTRERYTMRGMLPTPSTMRALTRSFEPPRIGRAALAPNEHVLDARRRAERQRVNRDDAIFRS